MNIIQTDQWIFPLWHFNVFVTLELLENTCENVTCGYFHLYAEKVITCVRFDVRFHIRYIFLRPRNSHTTAWKNHKVLLLHFGFHTYLKEGRYIVYRSRHTRLVVGCHTLSVSGALISAVCRAPLAPVRGFLADSACGIGGSSLEREITVIGCSGKRISAEKRMGKQKES